VLLPCHASAPLVPVSLTFALVQNSPVTSGESYRKWKKEYGAHWEQKFRQRYETDMITKYDTHFFVGTLHQYPGTWIIIGLFYPPHSAQDEMFAD
jgi:hypothetical protein